MKIYTKTGDSGISSLYSGERTNKSDPIFSAVGDVDELSSAIGICIADWDSIDSFPYVPEIASHTISKFHSTVISTLKSVQQRLLDVGASIATISNDKKINKTRFINGEQYTADLESQIDSMDAVIPPLTTFILPGGVTNVIIKDQSGYLLKQYGIPFPAHIHFARTVARRAERSIVATESTELVVLKYLNRLSDYLFVVARLYAIGGVAEIRYAPCKNTATPSHSNDIPYDTTQSYR